MRTEPDRIQSWQEAASAALDGMSHGTRALGRAIADSGRVIEPPRIERGSFVARVASSRGRGAYLVRGAMRGPVRCACSWSYGCKHIAAAFIVFLDRNGHGADPALAVPSMRAHDHGGWPVGASSEASSFRGDAAVAEWLARFAPLDDERRRLAFVLTLSPAPTVKLAWRPRIGRGDFGAPVMMQRREAADVVHRGTADAAAQDALDAVPWDAAFSFTPRGAFGAAGLGAILDSGRLMLSGFGAAAVPLARGPARAGRLTWRADDGGALSPSVDLEGGVADVEIVQVAPAYYVDAGSGLAGEIRAEGGRHAVAKWLSGPRIEERLAERFAKPFARVPHLPPPPAVQIVHVRERPVGVVVIREIAAPPRVGAPVRFAQLAFRYGAHRVLFREPGDSVRRQAGSERVVIHRRPDEEAELLVTLLGAGVLSDWIDVDGEPERVFTMASDADWATFLTDGVARLREEGLVVEIDPSVSLRLIEFDDWYAELEPSGEDWFDLELGVRVGDERISVLPLLIEAFRVRGQPAPGATLTVISPGGAIVRVPYERIAPLVDVLVELANAPPSARPRLGRWRAIDLAGVMRLETETWKNLRALRDSLARATKLPRVKPPRAVHAKLRAYQIDGLSWLAFLAEHRIGGVLADDMGLGKTLQMIALLAILHGPGGEQSGPSLVVAPTSVLLSWTTQLAEFAPGLRVVAWHGADRWSRRTELAGADVVLTSYALLHRDREELGATDWNALILDEAQYVKNARSVYAEVARDLRARRRFALTGTPLENHLGELWSIVSFAVPGALGDEKTFRAVFRAPIEKDGDGERLAVLRRRVAPFLLRRTKEEVAKDLPPKTIIEHEIELGDAQRDLYEALRQTLDRRVREEIAKFGVKRSQIVVLDALLKLRQVCCDPRLLKVAAAKRQVASAKLEAFDELFSTLLDEGRQILVFSQFVEMLELIAERLREAGFSFSMLTGRTVDRAGEIDRFQRRLVPVFLVSLKAGGTGLNLTAADTVIHYDPWWNPAVEAQATDRAHRIGQVKPVFVHRLITRGTVEEKIVALQAKKAELARGLLEGGGARVELDEALVESLFAPLPPAAKRRGRRGPSAAAP